MEYFKQSPSDKQEDFDSEFENLKSYLKWRETRFRTKAKDPKLSLEERLQTSSKADMCAKLKMFITFSKHEVGDMILD